MYFIGIDITSDRNLTMGTKMYVPRNLRPPDILSDLHKWIVMFGFYSLCILIYDIIILPLLYLVKKEPIIGRE